MVESIAELARDKKVEGIRDDLEKQMVFHLKRQAEAHADHLADALDVQKKELTREYARKLDEALEHANLVYNQELSKIVGHLKGHLPDPPAAQVRTTLRNVAMRTGQLRDYDVLRECRQEWMSMLPPEALYNTSRPNVISNNSPSSRGTSS